MKGNKNLYVEKRKTLILKKTCGEVYNCLCHGSDKIIGTSIFMKIFLFRVTSGNCDSP